MNAPPPRKKIHDFGAMLVRNEGSGILNWCLAGLDQLLHDLNDQADGDIALTEAQKKIVDSLLAESDSLRFFLEQNVELVSTADLTVNEIIEAYATFCPEMGWRAMPITDVQDSLEGLMVELFRVVKAHSIKRDGKAQRGFNGVALKECASTHLN